MILVDTNVLIDILSINTSWRSWSHDALTTGARQGHLIINGVVYAELAARYSSFENIEAVIGNLDLHVEDLPRRAFYLAGRAFAAYRAAGGPRHSILPDFFIGAHAATAGIPILTRDVRRYRSYFPDVQLIAPDE